MHVLSGDDFLTSAHLLIDAARETIWVSTFKLEMGNKSKHNKLNAFFNTLAAKAAAGLDVRLLTNKSGEQGFVPYTNTPVINYLKKKGVKVTCLMHSRICHAKIIITDCETAILGSHNLSVKSCHNNFEVSYLLKKEIDLSRLVSLYIQTWYSGKDA